MSVILAFIFEHNLPVAVVLGMQDTAVREAPVAKDEPG